MGFLNDNNNNSNEIEESMESIYSKLSQNNERQMYECIVSLCMIYLWMWTICMKDYNLRDLCMTSTHTTYE